MLVIQAEMIVRVFEFFVSLKTVDSVVLMRERVFLARACACVFSDLSMSFSVNGRDPSGRR